MREELGDDKLPLPACGGPKRPLHCFGSIPKMTLIVVAMTQSMDPQIEGWPVLREQFSAAVYGALVQ